MRSLVWLRSDLRLTDNPALLHASRESTDGVVAAFLVARDQWDEHDWGPRKIGYLLESLESLGRDLEGIGIPLVIEQAPRFTDAAVALERLLRDHDCTTLHANREYEFNESTRDRQVSEYLEARGFEIRFFDDQTVLPPGSILTRQGEPYSVFTPFWKSWLRQLHAETPEPLPKPAAQSDRRPPEISPPDSRKVFGEAADSDPGWVVGEEATARRLDAFLSEGVDDYHRLRDQPAAGATSGLSAALALGVLSPRTCLIRAAAADGGRLTGGSRGIEAWIRQLAWRDFYRHVLVGFPRVSRGRSFLAWADNVEWRQSPEELDAWRAGRTGVPLVDAGMRQLRETGWVHNRIRMVTAMFLSKDLLLDWRLGEAHFMRELLDGDFANNNGGWQWSASTGVDAAPYFRIMNPWTQARRFDPESEYIRAWVPELEELDSQTIHDPEKLAARIDQGLGYPKPLVDLRAARIRALTAFETAKQL